MPRVSLRLPSPTDWSGSVPPFLRSPRSLLVLSLSLLLLTTTALLWIAYGSPLSSQGEAQGIGDGEMDVTGHNYGIVIDAGSSGSKVQLFHWPPHDGDPANLLKIYALTDEYGVPLMRKVEPGISTFSDNPEEAYESLKPLLSFAMAHIPPFQHQQTSLYILCTAGMRLLPEDNQNRIINLLYSALPEDYPFYLPQDGVEVISGKMEGVFSWIAINYLLGRFEPESHQELTVSEGSSATHVVNTVGSLDMGGASLQVTFEIPQEVEVPSSHTVDINLGCGIQHTQHKHRVYISTYLGYGTNEARRRYYKVLAQQHATSGADSNDTRPPAVVRDPCLPLDVQDSVTAGDQVRLRGLGDFHACRRALAPLLWENSSTCVDRTCQVESFKRPRARYESLEFYGTSEFWYTMRDVLRIGGVYHASTFEKAARDFCVTPWSVLVDRYKRNLYPYADFYRIKTQCMKSAWMSLVLHEALGLPPGSTHLSSAHSINGHNVQWSLGALLYRTRFLPLREIQMHQMKSSPPSSPWVANSNLLTSLTESSFSLPLFVVVCVALLLLLCRQRRPQRYSLSRTSSYLSLSRTASHVSLSRNTSTARLASIISSS